MPQYRCNQGWAKRTYRMAECSIDGVNIRIEGRCPTNDADESPCDDDHYYDCRLTVDGIVEMEGQALFDYGMEFGESPANEPVQYLQKWLRENVDEDITLVV